MLIAFCTGKNETDNISFFRPGPIAAQHSFPSRSASEQKIKYPGLVHDNLIEYSECGISM